MEKPLYIIVKQLLIDHPELRGNDKRLQWRVCIVTGNVKDNQMTYEAFLLAPSMESIRRVRQKIQENIPSLKPSILVQSARRRKERMKGNFVYQEKIVPVYEFIGDRVILKSTVAIDNGS